MMLKMMKLLKNKYVLPIVCLLGGIAIGFMFYPSQTFTSEERARYEKELESTRQFTLDRIHDEMERARVAEESLKEYKRESETKVSSLKTENTRLKKKVKERIVKIVTPDGTIREEIVRESDTQVVSQIVTDIKQEFTEKVSSIEQKWKTIHKQRVSKIKEDYEEKLSQKEKVISEYSKKEVKKVNERNFGISLGYTSDKTFFSSITYDVYGPFFLDLHLETDKEFNDSSAGAAVGISF